MIGGGRRLTISRRLALAAAAAVAIAIALASLGAYFAVKSKLLGEVDATLQGRARTIERLAPGAASAPPGRAARYGAFPRPPHSVLPPPPQAAKRFGGATGVVQLVASNGRAQRPPGQARTALPIDAQTLAVARGKASATLQDETVDGERLRVLTAPLSKGGAVEVALPLAEVESTLSGLIELLAVITAGGVALAALLGTLVARASLAPIRAFTERTERIASRDEPLGMRLPVESEDELGRLARSYNRTRAALERSVAAQRQLVSDASHELRTPLTSLRANLEVSLAQPELSAGERRELDADVLDQLDELTRLVEEIVELARSGEQPACFVEVALAEIAEDALESVRPHAGGVSFAVDLEDAGVALGDADRLTRAVRNLLENAVKWSPPEGVVEVSVDGGAITVRDHGPGIAEHDLPHVFARFYRAAAARRMPGSGLGLAIVRQVADAHGASVSAGNAEGGGACMLIELPAPGEPAAAAREQTAGGAAPEAVAPEAVAPEAVAPAAPTVAAAPTQPLGRRLS